MIEKRVFAFRSFESDAILCDRKLILFCTSFREYFVFDCFFVVIEAVIELVAIATLNNYKHEALPMLV